MNEILQGLIQAFWLVLNFDSELITISLRSLYVTLSALTISALIAFPLAAFLVVTRFQFRQATIAILNQSCLLAIVIGIINTSGGIGKIKLSMKEKNVDKLAALRSVKSAMLLELTKDGKTNLNDETAIQIISKLVKQR